MSCERCLNKQFLHLSHAIQQNHHNHCGSIDHAHLLGVSAIRTRHGAIHSCRNCRLDANVVDQRSRADGSDIPVAHHFVSIVGRFIVGENMPFIQQSVRFSFSWRIYHFPCDGKMELTSQVSIEYCESHRHKC